LVIAFCAVVTCFVGSTAYTEWRRKHLDDAARTIANVSAVRINGLATVKRLATAHRGEVGVESAPGQGCTFWFELPRALAVLEDLGGDRVRSAA
jgi:signal transduction histidine kinase